MPRVVLSDRFCAAAKPLNGKRTDYFDAKTLGLALRVGEQGHRTWCFHFRSPRDGKRARATLGSYPATSLVAARTKALEARGHVEAGHDPRLIQQATADMTVAALIEKFLGDPQRAALRSKIKIEQRLRRNVLPVIGGVKLSELRRRDVRNVVDPLLLRGRKTQANRLFEDVRAMINWAVTNEYLELNPIGRMPKPAKPKVGDRCLSEDEIRNAVARTARGAAGAMRRHHQALSVDGAAPERGRGHALFRARFEGARMATAGATREECFRPLGAAQRSGHCHHQGRAAQAGRRAFFAVIAERVGGDVEGQQATAFRNPALGGARSAPHRAHRHGPAGRGADRAGACRQSSDHDQGRHHAASHSEYAYDKEKRQALDLWADRLNAIVGGAGAAVVAMRRP